MTELSRTRIHLDPQAFSTANTHRTPGLHLTDVIRDMLRAAGVSKPRKGAASEPGTAPSPAQLDTFLQGYAWEDIACEYLYDKLHADSRAFGIEPHSYCRLPEIAYNGRDAFAVEPGATSVPAGYIIMTPDGLLTDGEVRGLELKWTTYSVNMQPESMRADWFWQAPAYLAGIAAWLGQPVTLMEWHVQFPCGDYKGSGVIYERWRRRWSEQARADTWATIYGHAIDTVAAAVTNGQEHPWTSFLAVGQIKERS